MSAALVATRRAAVATVATVVVFASTRVAQAQSADAAPARAVWRTVGGAAAAFVAHESGHLVADAAFGAAVSFRRVEFHGIPFFAVAHRSTVTPRQEYVISSAGFWVQHATSEWILSRASTQRPGAVARGVLAFNVLTSAGYAGAAFAETGPAERDTRSMAVSLRVREPIVGAMILMPALLDAWRVWHPTSRRAAWTSRGAKMGLVLLTMR